MSKKEKDTTPQQAPPLKAEEAPVEALEAEETPNPLLDELETLQGNLAEQEEKFLRLAAEYDNYRKRSQKEKDSIWTDARAETAASFLPVYDNLERALKQQTCDEAYSKGVEMTMAGLREVFSKLGVEEIPALGQPFDPNLHNAVMHVEDEAAGENTIVEVFQTGFQSGDRVVRFAMVKVAN
ncbi:MAG: nucleotide exchange factor GrpE [Pseudoflavonifractor sp.]